MTRRGRRTVRRHPLRTMRPPGADPRRATARPVGTALAAAPRDRVLRHAGPRADGASSSSGRSSPRSGCRCSAGRASARWTTSSGCATTAGPDRRGLHRRRAAQLHHRRSLSILVQLPLGLGIALLLNRRIRGRGLLRTIVFVPYVVAEVIAGVVWFQLLQPESGVVDDLIAAVGPDPAGAGVPRYARRSRSPTRLRGADLEVPRPRDPALPGRSAGRSPTSCSRPPSSTGPAGGRSSVGSRSRCWGRRSAPGASCR